MTTEIEKRTVLTPEVIKTAKRLRDVSAQNGAQGTMVLFRLNPPLAGYGEGAAYEYVIASSVNAFASGYETLVFPSNEEGDVCDWGDIAGGHGMEADEAITEAGYELV